MADLHRTIDRSIRISRSVADQLQGRVRAAHARYADRIRDAHAALQHPQLPAAQDAVRVLAAMGGVLGGRHPQRSVLFWDTLRQRGNHLLAHEIAGKPPVFVYEFETIVDARSYERPVNYALVRIVPPRGIIPDDAKRPFVIVDPRADHGPGIGGFKEDSQVGVALSAGHPVYFVIFFASRTGTDRGRRLRCRSRVRPHRRQVASAQPQTGARRQLPGRLGHDAARHVAARYHGAGGDQRRPDVVLVRQRRRVADAVLRGTHGGCLAVAARQRSGRRPGRWRGPGANFEYLNPANTLWEKWYHLFAHVDTEPARFLEFERWWGGFFLFNEEELRWIVDNLFVGNRLSSGEARLGPGRYFDLKSIKQPIIVFASMGDNITPPQQAFNWIADVYSSTEEIKANGQTIVGLLHEDVGHLGIFVSGQVAKKEHAQIVEVLKYIQQLPPGLYGMDIEETHHAGGETTYEVTLKERKVEDLRTLGKNDRVDEKPFEAVAALSELTERAYSLLVRPFVREMAPEWFAKALRDFHPLRVQYWALSDKNPTLWPLPHLAGMARANRKARAADNDFVKGESLFSEYRSASLDLYRDLRDAASEAAFFEVYGNMMSLQMADEREEIRRKGKFDPRSIAAVREVLDTIEEGSAIEGLARIAMLINKAGSGLRRLSQMQRTREALTPEVWIAHLSEDERRRLLQEETIVVEFEPERAKRSLPQLLRKPNERRHAHALLDRIVEHDALDDRQRALVAELRTMLPVTGLRSGGKPAALPPPARKARTRAAATRRTRA